MAAKPRSTPPAPAPAAEQRARRQGLADAARTGELLTVDQLAFLTGRSVLQVQRLRNGARIAGAIGFRAWRQGDGWRLSAVDGIRQPGQPLG
jgi:hypothetical protein